MADIPCISKIVVRSKWKDVSQAPSTVLTNEELTECSVASLPLSSTCLGLSLPTCLLNTGPWMSWPWLLWFRALWIGQASKEGVIDCVCLPPQGHLMSSKQKAVTKKRAIQRMGTQWLMRRKEDQVCFQCDGNVSSVELMVPAIQL